jgi:hypothetical protein
MDPTNYFISNIKAKNKMTKTGTKGSPAKQE